MTPPKRCTTDLGASRMVLSQAARGCAPSPAADPPIVELPLSTSEFQSLLEGQTSESRALVQRITQVRAALEWAQRDVIRLRSAAGADVSGDQLGELEENLQALKAEIEQLQALARSDLERVLELGSDPGGWLQDAAEPEAARREPTC